MLQRAGLEFLEVFKSGNSVTCADQVFVTSRSDETSSDSLTFVSMFMQMTQLNVSIEPDDKVF